MSKLLIAIDFDGTLCENAWPNVGAPKWDVINKIKEMQEQGHEFILWTCRENADLIPVFKFLSEVGLTFRWINSNAEYRVKQFDDKDCRKIGADYYVDDKALSINDFVNLKEGD